MKQLFPKYFSLVFFLLGNLISLGQIIDLDSLPPPAPPPPPQGYGVIQIKKKWQNDEYKIELTLPYNWFEDTTGKPAYQISFRTSNGELFGMMINKQKYLETTKDIKIKIEAFTKSNYPSYEIETCRIIKIGGEEGVDMVISGKMNNSSSFIRTVYFYSGFNRVIINSLYHEKNRKSYENTLQEVLNSISFY